MDVTIAKAANGFTVTAYGAGGDDDFRGVAWVYTNITDALERAAKILCEVESDEGR